MSQPECLDKRKITLTPLTRKELLASQERQIEPKLQEPDPGNIAPQYGTAPEQKTASGPDQTALEPSLVVEPPDKEPVAPDPQMEAERHLRPTPEPIPEPGASVLQQPEHKTLHLRVPDHEHPAAPEPGAVPSDRTTTSEPAGENSSEEIPMEREARLEQAYQFLLAEGKKPSGRALAECAHVHRSTCVEWLRNRHQEDLPGEEVTQEDPPPEQNQNPSSTQSVEHFQGQQQERLTP